MENQTLENFDLGRYRLNLNRVNQDLLAERYEGRSTTIAAAILEGGLTFENEVYHVAVFINNLNNLYNFSNTISHLRFRSQIFVEAYSKGSVSVNSGDYSIELRDSGGNTKIKIKALVLDNLRYSNFDKLWFHNYFIDVSVEEPHKTILFSAIPLIQARLMRHIR
jgi:hypothetical protein